MPPTIQSTTVAPAPVLVVSPAARSWPLWLCLGAFALLWLDLCRQLSYMWSTNEQYAYGWFVPILALGLFAKKWPTRPLPSAICDLPSGAGSQSSTLFQLSAFSSHPSGFRRFSFHLSPFILLFLLLPLRIVHEINQDWSFCGYLLTLTVVALSLYAVFLTGGWSWVKHFAFPICFILVAVNWPYRIENSLKYRAMGAVSSLTVEIAGWLDIPALQHGNVIELATGSVGVEDACSGIRSFQSTIMGAWFLGELYLLNWPHRFLLLALGAPLAFSFNILRTLFLTWQASLSGTTAVTKWHDSAGITISVATFACLWLLSLALKKWTSRAQLDKPQVSTLIPPPSDVRRAPSFTFQLSSLTFAPWFSLSLAPWFSLSLALWVPMVLVATEAWYRTHDTDPAQTVRWSAQFPTNSPTARNVPIDKDTRQRLKYDQGTALSWDEPDGSTWSAFFFRWRSGEATSRMAARDHRPEICLPSTGYKLKTDSGILYLPAHGLELPFRAHTFEEAGRVLYVFFCLWEDGAEKQAGLGKSKYLDRLDSVLAGRRRLGQQTLEIIVSGYPGMAEAEQALRQRLPGLIQLGPAPEAPSPIVQQ
jgi:exosortase